MNVLPQMIAVYTTHLRGRTPDTCRWWNDLSHLLHSNWILAQAKRRTKCRRDFLLNIQRRFRFCSWSGSDDRKQAGSDLWIVTGCCLPAKEQSLSVCTQTFCLSQLTAWSRVLLEKLTFAQLVKKFLLNYDTHRFIAIFIRARHLSLS